MIFSRRDALSKSAGCLAVSAKTARVREEMIALQAHETTSRLAGSRPEPRQLVRTTDVATGTASFSILESARARANTAHGQWRDSELRDFTVRALNTIPLEFSPSPRGSILAQNSPPPSFGNRGGEFDVFPWKRLCQFDSAGAGASKEGGRD